ncbi:MAG TPA: metalloregulator ArsR/SmtB family transcription factor [Symbiobacteriaceae bacterium]|nr:metalloregulator ArsR/SmtB family transcription factor [Symbiobacteriaceae bacterium]
MTHSHAGWQLTQSIAVELDTVLGAVVGAQDGLAVARTVPSSTPSDWKAQWQELLGRPRPFPGVLGLLAWLAGVEGVVDYSQATLAMRELTLPAALARAGAAYAAYEVTPDTSLPPAEQLVDLLARGAGAMEAALGLQSASPGTAGRSTAYEAERALRFLRDGDLHSRFWHWLDRGYYEWYRPWRESQTPHLAAEEERAVAHLGAREGEGVPALDWLPLQHPLRLYPELMRAVREGRVRVLFWTQPFGLSDLWGMSPGVLRVTYAEPGNAFAAFRDRAVDIAFRANAFSDPNRLVILRLIRNYAKDNTQMAEFLGIARPAVSAHAKILREAGLIDTTQEGRAARHTINYGEIRRLFDDLARFLDLPDCE